jgi:uncharacterized protein
MRTLLLALFFQFQIPAPVGYVNDFAGAIDDATKQSMLAVIDEVRQKSNGEIVVVTVRDLGGRPSIDVARDIGRQWKVGAIGGPGDAARNAGVILLLKPGDRPGDGKADIAIATGSGSEGFITDALAGRVRDAIGRAAVDAGRYDAGMLVGVQLLAAAYSQEFGFELSGSSAPPPQATGGPQTSFPTGLIPLLLILFFFFVMRRRGARPSGLASSLLWSLLFNASRGRGGRGGSWGSGGWGGGGGGGFGGFGGGGGFSGGGASGKF